MPKIRVFCLLFIILFSLSSSSFAQIDDGFSPPKPIKGTHFTIFYSGDLDTFSLAKSLNIGPAENILAGEGVSGNIGEGRAPLAIMLDTLFNRISDILDMHLYSFHGEIKICKDASQLGLVYANLYNTSLAGKYSFYTFELNTIYISPEHFTKEVLGHEIAHAIISHYFVVQPPVKVAEILAGYVEYQLRKP